MAISAAITKGSFVEVSSDEPGFYGAWYAATFLEEDKRSPTKKRRSNKKTNRSRGGYLIKYHTLFEDENLGDPVTEVVDSSFVRPFPPRVVRRNNGDTVKEYVEEEAGEEDCGDEFEVYDVIDAYHRDGWWKGIVKTVIVEEGEMKKYVVSFENPPEDVEFEVSQLRFHVDWVQGRWLIPPRKTPEQEGDGGNAAKDAASEEVLILDPNNAIVGTPSSDKKKLSRSRKSSGSNSSVSGSVTYSRNRRNLKLVEADSDGKSIQAIAGSTVNAKTIVTAMETSGSDDINQDSPSVEPERIIIETNGAENGNSSQKRKRGRALKSAVKPVAVGSLEDGCVVVTDAEEPPLAVGHHQLKRSSCLSPQDNVGTTTTTDYQQNWPFVKRSAIWATVDSLGSYLATQKPHFSPLMKEREENREGLAIAHLVTFGSLVQRVLDLQTTDPADTIHNYMETALELETHGFDVGPIQVRLNKLLSLKSEMGQQKDKLEEVEKEIDKCHAEKCGMEKEMDELKAKLKDLQELMAKTVTVHGVKELEWLKLQSSLETLCKQRDDLNDAFKKLAGTPLS